MDLTTVFVALISLTAGVVIGFLYSRLKSPAGGGSTLELEKSLAAAEATSAGLATQIAELTRERTARDERDKAALDEQNKILLKLAPVEENIRKMELKVAEIERERVDQFNVIKTQLEESREQNKVLASNTSALQSALSNNQARGKWGEVSLRNLLEAAGMMPHVDFLEQVKFKNKDSEEIKPDCIIKYPGEKFVPVDSKFPLADFERAIRIPEVASLDDEKLRKGYMKKHVEAVKKHITDISGKNYYTILDDRFALDSAPEFTILFVPNDGVLAATLAEDASIMEFAFASQVALVSPNSLFGVLRSIQHIWRSEAQEQTMHEIIKTGTELHGRIRVLAEHAAKLGGSLNSAVGHFNAFVASLETRLLTTTRELNKKSHNLISDNRPIEVVAEIESSTARFTKPELTSDQVSLPEKSEGGGESR